MQYSQKNIERQILEMNSKHCKPILTAIYKDEGITQGELALKMNLLPSGLTAVIKKMENADIPLVTVTQAGKFRRYSLPEEVKQYLFDEEKAKNDILAKRGEEENLFLLLQRFVETAGEQWKEKMNFLLLDENRGASGELEKCFTDFMRQMKDKTLERDEEVLEVRAFIKNEVLLYLIDKYIEAEL